MSETPAESSNESGPASPSATAPVEHPIIFFDGVCGMCNRFVDIMIRADRRGVFRFAPLQGETAQRMLPPRDDNPALWSMLYLDERGLHDQSDASLQVYRRLGGIWTIPSWARFVPRAIRNPVYRFIARNRYRWFGRKESCRIPTPEERERFLP
jgi:predicted DCC family thiol-disulfide oxidoreductase YuxK